MNLASSSSSPLKHVLQWVIPFGITCIVIVGIVVGTTVFYSYRYSDKMFAGIQIANIPLSGLTREEAQQLLNGRTREIQQKPLVLAFAEHQATLRPSAQKPFITVDVDDAVERAFAIGRSHTYIQNAFIQFDARFRTRNIEPRIHVDEQVFEESIRHALGDRLHVAKEATFLINTNTTSSEEMIRIDPEQVGQDFDLPQTIRTLQMQAKELTISSPFTIPAIVTQPRRTQADLTALIPQATAWLEYAPLNLTAEDKRLTISTSTLANWISVTSSSEGWHIDLAAQRVEEDLKKLLVDVLKEPKEGHLTVKDGRLDEFTAPVQGIAINTTATIALLKEHQQTNGTSTAIQLVQITPKILGDGESLGIREVLGVGRSEFSGSPTNRRKNIALGAQKVHGTLLAPGTEFSLLKTLGEIDGEHGWLPELVIKGNQTIPEFGGGLCQIGTTSFRGALDSGLLITERRNHSYRVRYYEPAGTDATIYDPAPDFRFKNDSAHWILITSDLKKDTVAFTFWGTHDGRVVDVAAPRIFNIVPPPPKKEIETLDLPVGTVKCTESAHAGASASLDYTVTLPGQEPKKVTFNSLYKPWGAVCLVGVAQLSSSSTAATASTTQPFTP